jgi:hypothetical protein
VLLDHQPVVAPGFVDDDFFHAPGASCITAI